MGKRTQIQVLLVLLIGTFLVFGAGHFTARGFTKLATGNEYQPGTMIAGIEIAGKSNRDIEAVLSEKINSWLENEKLMLTYEGNEKKISQDTFVFDIGGTIANIQQGVNNPLVISVKEEGLQGIATNVANNTFAKHVDYEKLGQAIRNQITTLQTEATFDLNQYIKIDSEEIATVSSGTVTNKKFNLGMQKWIDRYPRIEVPANSTVSLLKTVGDLGAYYSNDELSFVASAIYKAIVGTNFEVVQRNISLQLPTYSELGYEARINKEKQMDLIFFNPNSTAYEIVCTKKDNSLEVKVVGVPFIYQYRGQKEEIRVYSPKTIVQYDSGLPVGTKKTKSEGVNGQSVTLVRVAVDESGNVVKREKVAQDYYAPVPMEQVHSTQQAQQDTTNGNSSTNTQNNDEVNNQNGNNSQNTDENNTNSSEEQENITGDDSDRK